MNAQRLSRQTILNRRVILFFSAAALIALIAVSLYRDRCSVLGDIAPADLREVQKLVVRELRSRHLNFEVGYFFPPGYVIRRFKDYSEQRLLWVEVIETNQVKVFVGKNKEAVLSKGHLFLLHKKEKWTIGGHAYWGKPNLAPNMYIPPD